MTALPLPSDQGCAPASRRLEGQVAAVTGGGSGIGEAICLRLAAEGARVAVIDLNGSGAELTAGLCDGFAVTADVSDSAAVDAGFTQIIGRFDRLDVLVNCAGIAGRAHSARIEPNVAAQIREAGEGRIVTGLDALIELTDDDWQTMLAVHLNGTFHCSRAAARIMREQCSGAIVNIASICGLEGCPGAPHYSAAKGGIIAFTRSIAKELIVQGIRANAIAPGFILTPMSDVLTDERRAGIELRTPIRRLGTPAEVAAAVAFLASDDAAFIVGETLSANGGLLTV